MPYTEKKHPVDTHVGKRIRYQRWMTGWTQEQLANKVGVKFQQVQKYETGANRVSASRLYEIAGALGVAVPFFFEGLANGSHVSDANLMIDKETAELLRHYYAIPEPQRQRIFDLARVLADNA
jgi:transcriptional regulator with XRE-family HTH domain